MTKSAIAVAAKGAWGRVVWASDESAKVFYDALILEHQAKLAALFQKWADCGRISNREKFKKLDDVNAPGEHRKHALFEFKDHQRRLIGETRGRDFVIAHGVIKKQDGLRHADLVKAAVNLSAHKD